MNAIDLRSDTVTRPTPAMRRAMLEAEVGDDVLGDDPTVLELERRVAALAGREAALYVPSGTMGNQIAVNVLTRPGEEAVLERESHIFLYEQGGIAANSGVLAHVLAGERGVLSVEQLTGVLRGDDDHVARVSLVCLENTHNRAGGAVVPLASLQRLAEAARARGLRVHLDGARLWNASIATGVPIAQWAASRRHGDDVLLQGPRGTGGVDPGGGLPGDPRRATSCASAGGAGCARSESLPRPACTPWIITSSGSPRITRARDGWRADSPPCPACVRTHLPPTS